MANRIKKMKNKSIKNVKITRNEDNKLIAQTFTKKQELALAAYVNFAMENCRFDLIQASQATFELIEAELLFIDGQGNVKLLDLFKQREVEEERKLNSTQAPQA